MRIVSALGLALIIRHIVTIPRATRATYRRLVDEVQRLNVVSADAGRVAQRPGDSPTLRRKQVLCHSASGYLATVAR